jgi:uncharacterized spore protein YtfJ
MDQPVETKGTSIRTLMEQLADRLGVAATARTIYGEPVSRDGMTVVPVAKVRYGFGGGLGPREGRESAGGGGGIQIFPIGFIEMGEGSARFRRIGPSPALVIATGLTAAAWLLARALVKAAKLAER